MGVSAARSTANDSFGAKRRGSALAGFFESHALAVIIVAGLVVRAALTPLTARLPNGTTDEGFWKFWMEIIEREGVLNIFRESDTDYVGYHWVLWLLTKVYGVMGGPYTDSDFSLHILVKIPPILFDVALIVTVYHATRILLRHNLVAERRAHLLALAGAAVIAFQPAVLYDSAVWAQTDSAITAAMLGALILAAVNRPFAAGGVLALGLAVKPHPIIIGPVLLILLWRAGGLRAVLWAAAGALLVAAIVVGPWILHGDLFRIIDVYEVLFTKERQRLSELAWNFWWIVDQRGDPRPGDDVASWLPITFQQVGLAISALSAGLALAYAWLRPGLRGALPAAALLAFAFYAWPVASHERYLYPFLALLLPVLFLEQRWIWLYTALSITFLLNLVVVAPPVHRWMDRWVYGEFGVWVSAANTVLFAVFALMLLDGLWQARRHGGPPSH